MFFFYEPRSNLSMDIDIDISQSFFGFRVRDICEYEDFIKRKYEITPLDYSNMSKDDFYKLMITKDKEKVYDAFHDPVDYIFYKVCLPRRPILNFLFYRNNNKRIQKFLVLCQVHSDTKCGMLVLSSDYKINVQVCILSYKNPEALWAEIYAQIYARFEVVGNVIEDVGYKDERYHEFYKEYQEDRYDRVLPFWDSVKY